MGGRPRKPTAHLKLVGADKKNPKRMRARDKEPEPVLGLGDPPEVFNEALKARWLELVNLCAPGVLTRQDAPAAELLCRLWQKSRDGQAKPAEERLLASLFGKFGMTPSERSKVAVEKKGDDSNPAKKYLA